MEFIYARGLNPIEHAMPEEPLEIYREREYICSVMPGGEVHYKERSEDADAVVKFIEDNFRNYVWCEYLPHLPFEGVSDYTKFYEAENAILAAKVMPNDKIEYVTWEYDYDRKGVLWGHYFGESFTAAKQDFAIRAGLIDRQKLFSSEQLAVLHSACVYRAVNDMDISFDDEKLLRDEIEHLEELSPALVELPEPEVCTEQSQEDEL